MQLFAIQALQNRSNERGLYTASAVLMQSTVLAHPVLVNAQIVLRTQPLCGMMRRKGQGIFEIDSRAMTTSQNCFRIV